MAWHLIEKIIEHSTAHSTLLGSWWVAIVFVFRIIVVASIGDSVYSDEQDEFVCNTKQPGCKQACYSSFAPISHIRYWAFQILATGTPPLIFITFAIQALRKIHPKPIGPHSQVTTGTQTSPEYSIGVEVFDDHLEKRSNLSNAKQNLQSCSSDSSPPPKYSKICRENKVLKVKRSIVKAYVASVIFRTLIEAGCMYGQYFLYGLSVTAKYPCETYPCIYTVECYVSRPQEKTIFLYFMLAVSGLCILINVCELFYLSWRRIKWERSCQSKKPTSSKSFILGTYPISDVAKVHNRHYGEPRPTKNVVQRTAGPAPPGYYIPDVDPPSEKYKSPNNGFPPIRLRAASFTTSESDVTTDDDTSIDSIQLMLEENARQFL